MKNIKNKKFLIFDMDGTIADLYGVENWLSYINNSDTTPYDTAAPIYDMNILNTLLNLLKGKGWSVIITTWLAGGDTSKEYDERVRKSKKSWLDRYNFPYDEVHLVKYGTTKADCTREKGGYQILIDDNEKIRNGWHLGDTIDATKNILPYLENLLKAESA